MPVGQLVAQGEAALGFQQLSELLHVPGITVLGTLPPAVAIDTVFSAAVVTGSTAQSAARDFLAFLASEQAAPAKLRQGMQPLWYPFSGPFFTINIWRLSMNDTPPPHGQRAGGAQRAPLSRFQWIIFTLCFCIVLLDGFDTAAIGYIAPSLMAEWGIAKSALGPVLSAALFGLAGGALCAGPLADRFGRKAVLVGSVLVFALACLASGYSHSLST